MLKIKTFNHCMGIYLDEAVEAQHLTAADEAVNHFIADKKVAAIQCFANANKERGVYRTVIVSHEELDK